MNIHYGYVVMEVHSDFVYNAPQFYHYLNVSQFPNMDKTDVADLLCILKEEVVIVKNVMTGNQMVIINNVAYDDVDAYVKNVMEPVAKEPFSLHKHCLWLSLSKGTIAYQDNGTSDRPVKGVCNNWKTWEEVCQDIDEHNARMERLESKGYLKWITCSSFSMDSLFLINKIQQTPFLWRQTVQTK